VKNLGTNTVNCLPPYPSGNGETVPVPVYLMYNGPPNLRHRFTISPYTDGECSSSSEPSIIVTGVVCEMNSFGDLEDDGAKIYPMEIKKVDGQYSFDLRLEVLDTGTRGQTIFNVTSFPFECNASMSLIVGSKILPAENVFMKVNYTFVESPDLITEPDEDRINNIIEYYAAEKDNFFWNLISTLEELMEYGGSWCDLGNTVKQVDSLVHSLGDNFIGLGKNLGAPGKALQALGTVMTKITGILETWLTGQAKNEKVPVLTNDDDRVYWGWEGSSLGGIACGISSCGGDSYLTLGNFIGGGEDSSQNWCNHVKKYITGAWVDQIGLQNQTDTSGSNVAGSTPSGQDVTLNDVGGSGAIADDAITEASDTASSADFVKSSFIASVLCLCIPGIVYNLNKYRQLECKLGYCLRYMTVSGGATAGECYGQYGLDRCNWFGGDIINLVMSALNIDDIFNNIMDMLNDPLASLTAGVKDGLACDRDSTSGELKSTDDQCDCGMGLSGGGLISGLTTILSTNYIQKYSSCLICSVACSKDETAMVSDLLALGIQIAEYIVYLDNSDTTVAEFFWKDGETNKMDWCAGLMEEPMGVEDNFFHFPTNMFSDS